jgi:hypothetical protein
MPLYKFDQIDSTGPFARRFAVGTRPKMCTDMPGNTLRFAVFESCDAEAFDDPQVQELQSGHIWWYQEHQLQSVAVQEVPEQLQQPKPPGWLLAANFCQVSNCSLDFSGSAGRSALESRLYCDSLFVFVMG